MAWRVDPAAAPAPDGVGDCELIVRSIPAGMPPALMQAMTLAAMGSLPPGLLQALIVQPGPNGSREG